MSKRSPTSSLISRRIRKTHVNPLPPSDISLKFSLLYFENYMAFVFFLHLEIKLRQFKIWFSRQINRFKTFSAKNFILFYVSEMINLSY